MKSQLLLISSCEKKIIIFNFNLLYVEPIETVSVTSNESIERYHL